MSFRAGTAGVDRHAVQTNVLANCAMVVSGGLSLVLTSVVLLRRATMSVACPASVDWILVAGHALRDGYPSARFRARLHRAAWIARRNPAARLLILGGASPGAPCSEAAAGRAFLEARGMSRRRMLLEEHSRNTLENFQQAALRLRGEARPALVLVTSRYHVARSETMARNLGLRVAVCPAEDHLPFSVGMLCLLVRETYLLHWYHVGRIYAVITGNAAMLERIRGASRHGESGGDR